MVRFTSRRSAFFALAGVGSLAFGAKYLETGSALVAGVWVVLLAVIAVPLLSVAWWLERRAERAWVERTQRVLEEVRSCAQTLREAGQDEPAQALLAKVSTTAAAVDAARQRLGMPERS